MAAMRIEHADARGRAGCPAGCVQEEGAFAATGGADHMHVLAARTVVDLEQTARIVDAKGDAFMRSDDRGVRCRPLRRTGGALRYSARRSARDLTYFRVLIRYTRCR